MPSIYHTGLTPPPASKVIQGFTISYCPVLSVEYAYINTPQDIVEILHGSPVILIMSKNGIIGLKKWLQDYTLDSTFFQNSIFWTVGDRTHSHLKETLGVASFYPQEMTGKGIIQQLRTEKISKVLLIAGKDPRKEFIDGLLEANVNFFHFPVYDIQIQDNRDFATSFVDDSSNYIIITSPSSVHGIMQNLSIKHLSNLQAKIISIGPTTSKEIRSEGGVIFYESTAQNIKTLYDNLEKELINS